MAFIDELKDSILKEKDEAKKVELRKKSNLIEKLIEVYIEHNLIIKDCFKAHYDFKVMQNKSLETCLNLKNIQVSMPLLIATYTNDV